MKERAIFSIRRWKAFDDPYFREPLVVFIDDQEAGCLKPEEHRALPIRPGRHVAQVKYARYKSRPVRFDVPAGQTARFETGFTRNFIKRALKLIFQMVENGVVELRRSRAETAAAVNAAGQYAMQPGIFRGHNTHFSVNSVCCPRNFTGISEYGSTE